VTDVWESAGITVERWESNSTPGVVLNVVIRDGDIVATVSDEQLAAAIEEYFDGATPVLEGDGAGGFLSGEYPDPGVNTDALATAVNALIVAGDGIEAVFDPGPGEDPPSLTLSAVLAGGGSNLRVDAAIADGDSDIDLDGAAPGDMPAVLVWGRAAGNGVYEASVVDGWTLLDPQPTLVVADTLAQAPSYDQVLDTGVASIYDYSDTAGWQPVGSVPTLDGNPSQVWGPTGWVTPDGGVALSDATPQDLGTAAAGVSDEASRADHVHDMPTAADIAVDASGFNGNLTTSDDTVQEVAQKLDDLVIPVAGIADPGGANDDFMQRKAGAWTNRTVAQVKADLGVGGPAGFYEDNVYHGLLGHIHSQLSGGGTGLVVGANLLVLWRIMPIETVDVDGFTLMVQVNGGSGGLARVGIFPASTSTTEPTGTPVVESGNLNVNVGGGTILTDTFTSGRLTAYTPYWGAFVTNSASLSVRVLAGTQNTQLTAMESGIVNSVNHIGRRVAHTFGALPPSPAAPFNLSVAQLPGVLWRTQRI
jgi:hypothetical protein